MVSESAIAVLLDSMSDLGTNWASAWMLKAISGMITGVVSTLMAMSTSHAALTLVSALMSASVGNRYVDFSWKGRNSRPALRNAQRFS